MEKEILENAKEFEKNEQIKKRIEKGKKELKKFLEKFPYREKPHLIDSLNPENLYNPGSEDYFFYWIEFKTKALGAIFTYGGLYYPKAVEKLDKFKQLLKITVDANIPISKKIDAEWGEIKGFGGDKLIAKKILFCYFPQTLLPMFKTEHLEHFCKRLDIDYNKASIDKCGKTYENLSTGEKYELLNNSLMVCKKQYLPSWDNSFFARFLYEELKPEKKLPLGKRESQPLRKLGLLYSPSLEQEVVYLFSNLHKDLGFPFIVRFQERFPDVLVMDKNRKEVRIEIEVLASEFNHDPGGCDIIVCWENDLDDIPDNFPPIISLRDFIED